MKGFKNINFIYKLCLIMFIGSLPLVCSMNFSNWEQRIIILLFEFKTIARTLKLGLNKELIKL